MALGDGKPWWRVLHIAVTAMFLLLSVVGFAIGQWVIGGVCAIFGTLFILFRAPLLRVAVTREPDAVVCRYVPWYEPGPYTAISMILVSSILPATAALLSDSGWAPGIFAVMLLACLPFAVAQYWRASRRCRLRITPAALTVPDPARGWAETTIARERVVSVAPVTQTVGRASTVLVLTAITFREGPGTGREHTVQVGPAVADGTVWLTVWPGSLLAGVQEWVRADAADPGLLDRLDAQLRVRTGNLDPRRLAAVPAVGPGASPTSGGPDGVADN